MNDPLKPYRKQLRLWNNNRRLKKEERTYHCKFLRKNLSIPSVESLQKEFSQRFNDIPHPPKGNLNIITVYHHYNWENYSLKPALEKFGTVRHYDWYDEFNHSDRKWRSQIKKQMNHALKNKIDAWMSEAKADMIFMYVSGELVEPDILASLRHYHVPMVNLALNDKEHFVSKIRFGRSFGARDICRHFDLCWTSTEDALEKYRVEGAWPIYLPEGANPDIHKPYDTEKTIDVSFVGQCYGNRKAVIDELAKRGITVETYGFGWPGGPLNVDDMIKLYSKSKINLGFGGVEGHPGTFCLKGRDFEIPMSGGLYLTENHPELANAFQPGKEILSYSGLDDLENKIRYYLDHPDEAEAIRKRGHERAISEHTWEARFDKILRILNILK